VQLNLTANEARIIGCLMEKSVITPDQYPLTLNSLTNACNQKSGRNPVMSLDKGVVQHTVRDRSVTQVSCRSLPSRLVSFPDPVYQCTGQQCNQRCHNLPRIPGRCNQNEQQGKSDVYRRQHGIAPE